MTTRILPNALYSLYSRELCPDLEKQHKHNTSGTQPNNNEDTNNEIVQRTTIQTTKMVALSFNFPNGPNAKTLEEAITALRTNNDKIGILKIRFNDENFPTSRALRNIILAEVASKNIKTLYISNRCRQLDLRDHCYEFVLQCIAEPRNTGFFTDLFAYGANFPLTLDDAKRMALSISNSNGHITNLGFSDDSRMFLEVDTMECIFNAVLEKRVPGFLISAMCISANRRKLIGRICTANKSKRTTNNTLKRLSFKFESSNDNAIVIDDDEIIQVSNVLHTFTGLDRLIIGGKNTIMSITGRQRFLEAMRDNTALTRLELPKCNSWLNLQTQIDDQIAMNRFWKSFTKRYKVGGTTCVNDRLAERSTAGTINPASTISSSNTNPGAANNKNKKRKTTHDTTTITTTTTAGSITEKEGKNKTNNSTIAVQMYPALLKILTRKPQFLFQFLKHESPTIFTSYGGAFRE